MTSARKVILVLIDGLSADYFEQHRGRLPHLDALSSQGWLVQRLHCPVPATSMPGRTSMITGSPSKVHGVFGNHVFDGRSFRCAEPGDVRVPTIARRARDAGLQVAGVGFAMVRPEDVDLYQPAWWVRGWMKGSRFAKVRGTTPVADFLQARDGADRLPQLAAAPLEGSEAPATGEAQLLAGFASDHQIIRNVAALACSDNPPDLILTEIAMTDQVQHRFGYESQAAHWSLETADLLVGFLRHQLERAGREDDYVLAIASDHGHSPIETAIFPDVVLPGSLWQSEGATLHVVVEDRTQRREVERRLATVGAESLDSDHVPPALRDRIATFAAPRRHSFEESPLDHDGVAPTGRPADISSHGLRPGAPADDRFCLLVGGGLSPEIIDTAAAERFCPTLASLLGLPETGEGLLAPG